MQKVEPVHTFDQIKLLADSRRMEILRLLMDSPSTLTHLARTLNQSPAWVRHHILALESGDLFDISSQIAMWNCHTCLPHTGTHAQGGQPQRYSENFRYCA